MVHALSGVHQHHFAATSGAGSLTELNGVAHGLSLNLLAGLALGAIQFGLDLLAQRPGQCQHQGLGHQNTQVGVGAYRHSMATATLATSALPAGPLTQPGAGQGQGQVILTQTRRSSQKPGVPALGEQLAGLCRYPGWHRAHGNQPRACTACCTASQTASRG